MKTLLNKYRIRERKFNDGESEFIPEILCEYPIYGEWKNIGLPMKYFIEKTYADAFQQIEAHKKNSGRLFEEKFYEL